MCRCQSRFGESGPFPASGGVVGGGVAAAAFAASWAALAACSAACLFRAAILSASCESIASRARYTYGADSEKSIETHQLSRSDLSTRARNGNIIISMIGVERMNHL